MLLLSVLYQNLSLFAVFEILRKENKVHSHIKGLCRYEIIKQAGFLITFKYLLQPVFLHRTLSYMKHRRTRPASTKKR